MVFSLQHLRVAALFLLVVYYGYDLLARAYGVPNGLTMELAGVDILFVGAVLLTAVVIASLVATAVAWLTRERPMWSRNSPTLSFDKERRVRNATAPRMNSGIR